MRWLTTLLLMLVAGHTAAAQLFVPSISCPNGSCPSAAAPAAGGSAFLPPAALGIDTQAIARVVNCQGAARVVGTGTLIDRDSSRGLVITCAHLFRDGAGAIRVTFPNGQAFDARLLKSDEAADLALVAIRAPSAEPVPIANSYPQQGDLLVSCGYGGDGQLQCNRGRALGYVTIGDGRGAETLELTGSARQGDSGGPIFNQDRQLVAVLFGTDGRVVDGTFCGRIRRFVRGATPSVHNKPPAAPPIVMPPGGELAPIEPPKVAANVDAERLARLEQLLTGLGEAWKSLETKIDTLATATPPAVSPADGPTQAPAEQPPPSGTASPMAPTVELPPGVGEVAGPTDPLEKVAEPWLAGKLAALLVWLGLPGGVAGAAAAAVVWLLMRRAKNRLQAELDRLQTSAGGTPGAQGGSPGDAASSAGAQVLHQNRYIPYENNVLDKAWADAHAILVEKYPGFRPALEAAERLKNQLLAGVLPQNSES